MEFEHDLIHPDDLQLIGPDPVTGDVSLFYTNEADVEYVVATVQAYRPGTMRADTMAIGKRLFWSQAVYKALDDLLTAVSQRDDSGAVSAMERCLAAYQEATGADLPAKAVKALLAKLDSSAEGAKLPLKAFEAKYGTFEQLLATWEAAAEVVRNARHTSQTNSDKAKSHMAYCQILMSRHNSLTVAEAVSLEPEE